MELVVNVSRPFSHITCHVVETVGAGGLNRLEVPVGFTIVETYRGGITIAP